jgi:TolB protein
MSPDDWMEYYEVWVVNADGSGLTNLTPLNAAADYQPAWSPDGKKLAIASTRYAGSQYGGYIEMYTINPDGTGAFQLTFPSQTHNGGTWAPGGDRIAFMGHITYDPNNPEIFVINADGTNLVQLTNNYALDYYPSWQPM